MNRAWAYNNQESVIALFNDLNGLVTARSDCLNRMGRSRDLGLKELGGKQWVISEDTSVLVDLSSFYEGHDLSWGCSDVGVKKKKFFLRALGEDGAVVLVVKTQEEAAKTNEQKTSNQLKKRRWSQGRMVI
jgi:hypothetical protein